MWFRFFGMLVSLAIEVITDTSLRDVAIPTSAEIRWWRRVPGRVSNS
jgi:hypothetical protein